MASCCGSASRPLTSWRSFTPREGRPAASTPVTDGKTVVSYFGSCGLVAYDFAGKELWQHKLPVIQSPGSFGSGGSPVLAGGVVLVSRDQAGPCSLLAVDLKSGKIHYQQERLDAIGNYYASPVAADGRVFFASLNGKLTVVAAGGDTPKVLPQADFGERISATPALVEGALYVRPPTALYAIGK